nr:MAG TPA: hypothetical protein [Caudoviricetes sp.]
MAKSVPSFRFSLTYESIIIRFISYVNTFIIKNSIFSVFFYLQIRFKTVL